MPSLSTPCATIDHELALARACAAHPAPAAPGQSAAPGQPILIAGIDEVGRGAWAGPLTMGIVAVEFDLSAPTPCTEIPAGLRDSKLVSPSRREQLIDPITTWAAYAEVIHIPASDIDSGGLSPALHRGARALVHGALDAGYAIAGVIIDGTINFLADTQPSLWHAEGAASSCEKSPLSAITVELLPKADRLCATVAGASVLAKVRRDALMTTLEDDFPGYGFARNKGYGTASHRAALAERGLSPVHRHSWKLPIERGTL